MTGVWERNVTGHGVTVVVVDDGVEHTIKDIQPNYVSTQLPSLGHDAPARPEMRLGFWAELGRSQPWPLRFCARGGGCLTLQPSR